MRGGEGGRQTFHVRIERFLSRGAVSLPLLSLLPLSPTPSRPPLTPSFVQSERERERESETFASSLLSLFLLSPPLRLTKRSKTFCDTRCVTSVVSFCVCAFSITSYPPVVVDFPALPYSSTVFSPSSGHGSNWGIAHSLSLWGGQFLSRPNTQCCPPPPNEKGTEGGVL